MIFSETHPAGVLSDLIELEPDEVFERRGLFLPGDEHSGRRTTSVWGVTTPVEARDDPIGYGALEWIVNRFEGKGPILAQLAADYDVDLSWWGQTDHWEKRVRIPASLMAKVASLRCPFTLTFAPVDAKTGRYINDVDDIL